MHSHYLLILLFDFFQLASFAANAALLWQMCKCVLTTLDFPLTMCMLALQQYLQYFSNICSSLRIHSCTFNINPHSGSKFRLCLLDFQSNLHFLWSGITIHLEISRLSANTNLSGNNLDLEIFFLNLLRYIFLKSLD